MHMNITVQLTVAFVRRSNCSFRLLLKAVNKKAIKTNMSESANVRQNLQNLPSIFELTAAETLDNLIYPALSKIFDYLGLRLDVQIYGTTQNVWHIRELTPFITWSLQYLYLRKRGASFGESFYGLLRKDSSTGKMLDTKNQLLSATLLTSWSYAEKKLLNKEQNRDISKWQKNLLNCLRIYKVVKIAHIVTYLMKYTNSHSPVFKMLGFFLTYPNEIVCENKTTYIFLKLLEVTAFFLQFIQWWYSSDQKRKVGGSLINPEPIKFEEMPEKMGVVKGRCPICLMELSNPTACATSGYVYCWKCIINHLRAKASCPTSGYGITYNDLIRIYDA
ncbi:peroxisome assembly protein 12 [Glossina fuscipes]|uniref:Peroxisome assembly protein 12 n=1 Tax=Glossina fuscipes TaxID=7396 RepID=A0A9C6DP62_9MUSC|nr:peroxisome assembly protein 12 [Glossina fuscipes]